MTEECSDGGVDRGVKHVSCTQTIAVVLLKKAKKPKPPKKTDKHKRSEEKCSSKNEQLHFRWQTLFNNKSLSCHPPFLSRFPQTLPLLLRSLSPSHPPLSPPVRLLRLPPSSCHCQSRQLPKAGAEAEERRGGGRSEGGKEPRG